jgi:pimeloyl-ACP methyl ester carboxylesterase
VLAEGIKDAELVIFENSSHMAFIEERAAYIQVVEAFLARVEARSGPG